MGVFFHTTADVCYIMYCLTSFWTMLLYKSLVFPVLLNRCDTWTLLSDTKRENIGIQHQVSEKISLNLLHGMQNQ